MMSAELRERVRQVESDDRVCERMLTGLLTRLREACQEPATGWHLVREGSLVEAEWRLEFGIGIPCDYRWTIQCSDDRKGFIVGERGAGPETVPDENAVVVRMFGSVPHRP